MECLVLELNKDKTLLFTRIAIASIIIGILIFMALITYAPDDIPFSPNNYGWNGMQQIYSQYKIHLINSYSNVPSKPTSTLIIMQPVYNFTTSDASSLKSFVSGGGTLIIADSEGTSNSLLQNMGLPIQINESVKILDNAYNWKEPSLPNALVTQSSQTRYSLLQNVLGIAMDEPSPLVISNTSNANEIAMTSSQSYIVARTSNVLQEPIAIGIGENPLSSGPFPVAAAVKIGSGTVFVIGDSEFFLNSVWSVGNNRQLISNLFSNSTVYLDTSHWKLNTEASVKAEVAFIYYGGIAEFPYRYLFTIAFVGAAIALVPISHKKIAKPKAVSTNQNYDPAIIERIRKDRARYGAK